MSDLREKIARANYERDPKRGSWDDADAHIKAVWRDKALGHITAITEAGCAVVPVEPSEAMQDAMLEAVKDGIAVDDDAHRSIRHGYRAMLAAARTEERLTQEFGE